MLRLRRLEITWLKENPPMGNIKRKNNTAMPAFPMERYTFASFSGRINAKIFEPSKGGMGSKLNIARSVFI